MTWNHRVVRKQGLLQVYEVYYDELGRPASVTETAVSPMGDNLQELASEIKAFAKALSKPILDFEKDFPTT